MSSDSATCNGNSSCHKTPNFSPKLMLYTRSGCIPYLNWNFIYKNEGIIFDGSDTKNRSYWLKLNASDVVDYSQNSNQNSNQNFFKQPYFDRCKFVMTLFDPLQDYKDFKSTNEAMAIQTLHGKKLVYTEELCSLATNLFGTEHIQAIADINTPPIAKSKWASKAVSRTTKFLEQMLKYQTDSITPVNLSTDNGEPTEKSKKFALIRPIKIWATVSGGFSIKDRIESCKTVSKYADNLEGIIVDSFYGYHKKRDGKLYFEDSYQDCGDILENHVLPNLPSNLPCALFGAFFPDDILRLICSGISVFDSSICTLLTSNGFAFPSPLIDLEQVKLRFTNSKNRSNGDNKESETLIIDLNHPSLSNANVVISDRCQCYCCTNGFTRAYINHLLKRKELNGSILLQIHNHFTLTQFIAQISQLIAEKRFESLLVNSCL